MFSIRVITIGIVSQQLRIRVLIVKAPVIVEIGPSIVKCCRRWGSGETLGAVTRVAQICASFVMTDDILATWISTACIGAAHRPTISGDTVVGDVALRHGAYATEGIQMR
jgi:hypothetical protein